MTGAERRAIKASGREYDVLNPAGDSGGRDLATYEQTGTLTAVVARRSRPQQERQSDGTDAEVDLELRAVVGGVAVDSGNPTKLRHPNGTVYRVLHEHEEDGGLTVISVMED